jgi:acyl-CoA thioester hydrolase
MAQDPLRPLLVELPFALPPHEIDVHGQATEAVLARWLAELREHFLRVRVAPPAQPAGGVSVRLLRSEITYKHPVSLGEPVQGCLWLSDASRLRWTVSAELRGPQHLAVAATQVAVFWSLDARRAIPVPDALVAGLDGAAPTTPDGGRPPPPATAP